MTLPSVDTLRVALSKQGLDAILITSPFNRRYLSGFTAEDHAPDESSGVLLVGPETALLLTSSTNGPWARAESIGFEVEYWQRPWEAYVAKRASEFGFQRIGFEERNTVVSTFNALKSADSSLEWVAVGSLVDSLRAFKSQIELDHLAKAVALTDLVFAEVAASIKPGDTEREVGWRIERLTREITDGTVAFPPIVASGPHAARPHHAVSDRKILEGETIIIDMGVASNGYCGDLTRTLWLGEASSRMKEVYNVVHRANAASIAAIKPGVPAKEIDALANEIMSAAGFKENLLHSLGHGLGLRVHESPSLSVKADDVLQVGHVVTVEPGIYIEDWGGIRIEDVVVVTEQGCRVLTAAEKHGEWEI